MEQVSEIKNVCVGPLFRGIKVLGQALGLEVPQPESMHAPLQYLRRSRHLQRTEDSLSDGRFHSGFSSSGSR
jgi:hypothetical protein